MNKNVLSIIVAASNSNENSKSRADFVCNGTNDEKVLQQAIEECDKQNKRLLLLNGIYNIDNFYDFGDNGPKTALCIPNSWKETTIIGQNHEYGQQISYDNGVVLYVSAKALESIGEDGADVIRGAWTDQGIQNGSSLHMDNITVVLENNQHKIRCVDLRRTDRPEIKNLSLYAWGCLYGEGGGLGAKDIPIPANGCIGLTMTDGSNNSYSNYINVQTYGFDEGIQVGGEHVVLINCGCGIGNYGFTFGNYAFKCGWNHPITLINCMDERNINMPLFNMCGDYDGQGNLLQGLQEVTFINFNMERVAFRTPGGKLGDYMREVHPGTWRGNMEVTVQPEWAHLNAVDCQLWENDGSGTGIKTRNSCHKTICDTAERMSYYPTYGQQIYDTDLNKMVICIDPATKKWVDFNGNNV